MATQEQKQPGTTGVVQAGSTQEIHKQVARSVYDAFNAKQYDRCVALANDDIQVTTVAFGATEKGKDGFKRWLSNWGTSMPDCKVELKRQYATDTGIVNEFHVTGTHKAPLVTPQGELKPTGNKLSLDVVEVWDLKDGKISKLRCYFDGLNMMRTFGAL